MYQYCVRGTPLNFEYPYCSENLKKKQKCDFSLPINKLKFNLKNIYTFSL